MKIHESDSIVSPKVSGGASIELKLVEQFVDEAYKRDAMTPKGEAFFNKVKANLKINEGPVVLLDKPKGEHIGNLDRIPIPFRHISEFGEKLNHTSPIVSMWMRMAWKTGLCRRFIVGQWQGALSGRVSGNWYGVHYLW